MPHDSTTASNMTSEGKFVFIMFSTLSDVISIPKATIIIMYSNYYAFLFILKDLSKSCYPESVIASTDSSCSSSSKSDTSLT